MASVTIVSDEVSSTFTLKNNQTEMPIRVYVGDDSFSVFVMGDGAKLTFEYILYEDKMIIRRRVNGLYDVNVLPDVVIWQK